MKIDARIPVHIGKGDPSGAALLIEGAPVPPGAVGARFDLVASNHAPGCACCLPRGPVAEALTQLFLRRARGDVQFFDCVLAPNLSPAGDSAVRQALVDDPVASARFRLEE